MQPPAQPATHSDSPPLDPTEIIALAAMKAVGAVFLNPHLVKLVLPPVNRAIVTFEGCAASGRILDTELVAHDDRQLESREAARLLEAALPVTGIVRSQPLGKLLAGSVLILLDIRYPGWSDNGGCLGRVELHWGPRSGIETGIERSAGAAAANETAVFRAKAPTPRTDPFSPPKH